jgi:integrase/recombinase XerD
MTARSVDAEMTTALVPASVIVTPGITRLTSPTWAAAVAQFLDWLVLVRGRAPLTRVAYARVLRGFVGFAQAHHLLDPRDVDFRDVEAYLGWLGGRGRQPALLLQHLSGLRAFYRYLEREGMMPNNPAALAVGPKRAHRSRVFDRRRARAIARGALRGPDAHRAARRRDGGHGAVHGAPL